MTTVARVRGKQMHLEWRVRACKVATVLFLATLAIPARAREKDALRYGDGLVVNIPLPIAEVAQAVEEVAGNGIIRGTKEYNKDEYVSGAEAATATTVFPAWTSPGQVFYKLRKEAVSPWNFKGSSDVGTLAVRYVVQPQGERNTVLRINAVFVEDFRHREHESDGTVENSEYKDIQEHLHATELLKQETAEAEQAKQEHAEKQDFGLGENTELLGTPAFGESSIRTEGQAERSLSSGQPSSSISGADLGETPEQHVAELKRQVERLVKKPGAALKSAPFHNSSTLRALDPGTEVLIVIVTPYWFGVETHDGAHGWIRRNQLELLP